MPSRLGSRNKRTLAREALIRAATIGGAHVETTTKQRSNAAKLSFEDMILAAQLSDAGNSHEAIAAQLKVHRTTIGRALSLFGDTRAVAKKRLQAAAAQLADVAITASQIAGATGNAEPALEILDRLETLPRRHPAGEGAGPRIMVVVGQPSLQALPPGLAVLDQTAPRSDTP